jgi:hypothetical protein
METDLGKIKLAVQAVLQNYDLAALFPDAPPQAIQTASAAPVQAAPAASRSSYGDRPGIFKDLDAAVSAASAAQKSLIALPLGARRRIVEAIKKTVLDNNESLSLSTPCRKPAWGT